MYKSLDETFRHRVTSIATGATAVATTAAVPVKPQGGVMSVLLEITGGTARTAQAEVAFDAAGPWIPVGTSRTAIGNFLENVPSAPLVRLNLSANTGSTVNLKVYG